MTVAAATVLHNVAWTPPPDK